MKDGEEEAAGYSMGGEAGEGREGIKIGGGAAGSRSA